MSLKNISVIKVSGSLFPKRVVDLLDFLYEETDAPFVLVPGGGAIVHVLRGYQKESSFSTQAIYESALLAMMLHARLLGSKFGIPVVRHLRQLAPDNGARALYVPEEAPPSVGPADSVDVNRATSDSIAADLALQLNADFIKATVVDGVFDKDPATEDSAQLQRRVLCEDLIGATCIDSAAPTLLRRTAKRAWIVNGHCPDRIVDLLEGRETTGTELIPTVLTNNNSEAF